MSLHYEIFAQIAEKMSTFGNVDVKQYTSKRVLVAVANHGRLVSLSNSFVFFFYLSIQSTLQYSLHINNERKDGKRLILHRKMVKDWYCINFICIRNRMWFRISRRRLLPTASDFEISVKYHNTVHCKKCGQAQEIKLCGRSKLSLLLFGTLFMKYN